MLVHQRVNHHEINQKLPRPFRKICAPQSAANALAMMLASPNMAIEETPGKGRKNHIAVIALAQALQGGAPQLYDGL